jgi:glycosyltransferase involved in cell wall biosynthesis
LPEVARIAVVSSHPPFSEGGHLAIARATVDALRESGYEADLVLTPQNRFGRQGAAYLANWLTDIGESEGRRIDQVISLRFPAYVVRHATHVCWLSHTMREYYDLWADFAARLSWKNAAKERIRRWLVHRADRHFLGSPHLKRLFVISDTVRRRLRDHIGVESHVLYPPPPARAYRCDGYGEYIFAVSRLTPLKRVDLLVRALAEPAGRSLRAVIAGDGNDLDRLTRLARDLGVEARVTFTGRVDEGVLLDHYARCRAVCFTPRAEDYGFVTAEAFASRKPVVACLDSGGPAELIDPGRSGLLCAPEPAAVAAALAELMDDSGRAERLGAEGARRVAALTWRATIERLVVV